jgi:hypothetical protein
MAEDNPPNIVVNISTDSGSESCTFIYESTRIIIEVTNKRYYIDTQQRPNIMVCTNSIYVDGTSTRDFLQLHLVQDPTNLHMRILDYCMWIVYSENSAQLTYSNTVKSNCYNLIICQLLVE